jgi:hypothetical protein
MTTPTQRTLKWARDLGYTVQVVEKWNPHARIRQDLFGCIDIVGLSDKIIGIQACADSSRSARVKKSLLEPRIETWLKAGGRFLVVSWGKKGPRGKRKTWTGTVVELALNADGFVLAEQWDENRSLAIPWPEDAQGCWDEEAHEACCDHG